VFWNGSSTGLGKTINMLVLTLYRVGDYQTDEMILSAQKHGHEVIVIKTEQGRELRDLYSVIKENKHQDIC